jgi:DNA-binding IclR family transcriptional regulator
LDQNEALYVDKVESDEKPGGLQMVSRVGSRMPVHSSSVGKVFLAQLSDQELDRLIKKKGLKKRTKNTITDTEKLKHHLKVIRQKGFAVDDEENEKGIRCVGAPIFNRQGQVIAAISISGPTVRITKKIIQQTLKNEVIRTASDVSREFGYQC